MPSQKCRASHPYFHLPSSRTRAFWAVCLQTMAYYPPQQGYQPAPPYYAGQQYQPYPPPPAQAHHSSNVVVVSQPAAPVCFAGVFLYVRAWVSNCFSTLLGCPKNNIRGARLAQPSPPLCHHVLLPVVDLHLADHLLHLRLLSEACCLEKDQTMDMAIYTLFVHL